MNEDCSKLSCPVLANPVQGYLNQYTLQGQNITNAPYTTIINGQTVTVAGGAIVVPVPPVGATSVNFNGCSGPISIPIPVGATAADILALTQQVVALATQQQAICNNTNQQPQIFFNDSMTIPTNCTSTTPLTVSVSLWPGLSVSGNSFVLAPHLFASAVSVTEANATALAFAQTYIANLFTTGGAVCALPYTCAPGCSPTLAGLQWTGYYTISGPINVPISGTGNPVTFSIPVPPDSPFTDYTPFYFEACFCNNTGADITFQSMVDSDPLDPSMVIFWVSPPPGAFIVPAYSTVTYHLEGQVNVGGPAGGTVGLQCVISIVP